jgi:uncharacterized ion transporter superfamily protein YfcC
MVLFSLLGTTMGFSVETSGFYSLFIPLMAALGYDRMVTCVMIIVGALVGVTASTVNPFATGVQGERPRAAQHRGYGRRLASSAGPRARRRSRPWGAPRLAGDDG